VASPAAVITDVDSTNATTRPVVFLTGIRDGSDEAISGGETTLCYSKELQSPGLLQVGVIHILSQSL